MVPVGKPQDFKGTLRKMLSYLGKYKIRIFIVMIFAVLSTIFAVLGPRILGYATTKLFQDLMGMVEGTSTGIDFVYIGKVLLTLLVIYVASSAFMYIQGHIMSRVTMDVTFNMRKDIAHKINKLPFVFLRQAKLW